MITLAAGSRYAFRFLTALPLFLFLTQTTAFAETISVEELEHVRPGTILRMWPLQGGVRTGYKGYRILYRSTGLDDEPIAVSGAVMFPEEVGVGPGRPIVAWAHPTSGVEQPCAPSLMPDLAGNIQGIDRFTDRGYVIAASDYAGLGAPGAHPYLVGTSAARAVLDSVRAVRNLKSSRAGEAFVVWGHSQGGHAALFTGIHAETYAPDLDLVGVATAAPATKLVELFELDKATSSGRTLTSFALHSWSRVFDVPVDRFVAPHAKSAFLKLASDCSLTIADFMKESSDEKALAKTFLIVDPTDDPDVRTIMSENTPGLLPAGTPVFFAQGTHDEVVRPHITRSYAAEICDGGASVTFHDIPGGSHMWAGRDGAYAAAQWMETLFKGGAPPNHC